jgi:DNA-binding transcriptional MerR regulator
MSAAGDDAKLSANQEQALAALLATPTITAAAGRCGLNERTIRRYLEEPEFERRYTEARDHLLDQSIFALQKLGVAAVAVLGRNFEAENRHVQIRAAKTVLDTMLRGVELVEIQERLQALESEEDDDEQND